MSLSLLLTNEKSPLEFELSANGSGTVTFFGGQFWFPSDALAEHPSLQSGSYETFSFGGNLFKGAVQPKGIKSFKKLESTKNK
tara:strand:+ start:2238 stop:2486 length:249 start_codon:yes stop_codon:yes gene_type:complete